jgi:aminopeptidase N
VPSLTHAEAVERSALLSVDSYRVHLDFTGDQEIFACTTTIVFCVTDPAAETFIEIRPDTLVSVLLNGEVLDTGALVDGRLPLRGLNPSNVLHIVADMAYSAEGVGMRRYTDPADGRVYVYAQAAPDAAPQIFPCFDQPDLKARYTITVNAPDEWIVLGTGEAEQVSPGQWQLAETPPISTYLVTVVAGPYESLTRVHEGVPLGLHCRVSMLDALRADADELFEITGQCLDAYQRMFSVPYQFGKYDQVFVPEFGNLAMENPGCVLIRDQRLFRGAVSDGDREDRAVIIAHEMSHMWFGNLVTMTWWDDLWLNEAFADNMGHRIASEVTRFRGALTTFAAGRKGLGYMADERPSTHPLSAPAEDVAAGLTRFDHISYFKGSAVVRQLVNVLGDDAFLRGLHTYFRRHGYGNAGYQDFLTALGDGAGRDLRRWGQAWFRESGVNTLHPDLEVRDGRITAAAIVQTAPEGSSVLRPHTFDVGCYGTPEQPAGQHRTRVTVAGPRTELPELLGAQAPRFLLLNDGDQTYAKIRFDPASEAALPEVLPALPAVDRAMVWGSLLLAVRDAAFPAQRYLSLVDTMLDTEPELSILREVLAHARAEVVDRYLDPASRDDALRSLAAGCERLLARTEPADERRLTVYRMLVESTTDTGELRRWLAGSGVPAGLTIDPELAWRIRYRLAVQGAMSAAEIAAAYQDDRSAQGENSRAMCSAALPSEHAKEAAWDAIMTDADLSNYGVWARAEAFWHPEQAELTAPYVERFFAELPTADKLRGPAVQDGVARLLFPRFAAVPSTIAMAEAMLSGAELCAPVRRRTIDSIDDLRRVIAARQTW